MRHGGIQLASKSEVKTELIQQHGDWVSDCYKEFLTYDFKQKLSVSKKMCSTIIKTLFVLFVARKPLTVTLLSASMAKHVTGIRNTVVQSFKSATIARLQRLIECKKASIDCHFIDRYK